MASKKIIIRLLNVCDLWKHLNENAPKMKTKKSSKNYIISSSYFLKIQKIIAFLENILVEIKIKLS